MLKKERENSDFKPEKQDYPKIFERNPSRNKDPINYEASSNSSANSYQDLKHKKVLFPKIIKTKHNRSISELP